MQKKLFTAHAVYGLYPANSEGDDIVLYGDVSRTKELTRFHTLRQQKEARGASRSWRWLILSRPVPKV